MGGGTVSYSVASALSNAEQWDGKKNQEKTKGVEERCTYNMYRQYSGLG